jgi:hypothetical protein
MIRMPGERSKSVALATSFREILMPSTSDPLLSIERASTFRMAGSARNGSLARHDFERFSCPQRQIRSYRSNAPLYSPCARSPASRPEFPGPSRPAPLQPDRVRSAPSRPPTGPGNRRAVAGCNNRPAVSFTPGSHAVERATDRRSAMDVNSRYSDARGCGFGRMVPTSAEGIRNRSTALDPWVKLCKPMTSQPVANRCIGPPVLATAARSSDPAVL